MLEWYKDKKDDVKEAFDKGAGNALMVCSDIQKDLAKCCAQEVMAVIKDEIGDKNFSVLVDEANDSSIKEQMAVIVRFVSNQGKVMERFLAIKHISVDIFNVALDAIMKEMNHRFNEVSSELVVCISCLDLRNYFSKLNVNKLVRFAEIYSDDFTISNRLLPRSQLQTFIINVRRSEGFNECHDISNLAQLMVQTNKHLTFTLVYRLIELALILPVATSSIERIFSAMSIIKTDLRNKRADDCLNDLIIFKKNDDDAIMKRFQALETRRISLPHNSIAGGCSL